MLARLICRLLGHVLEDLNGIEDGPSCIYVHLWKCARCGRPILEVRDLRNDEDSDRLQ